MYFIFPFWMNFAGPSRPANTTFLGFSHSFDRQTSGRMKKYQMVFYFVPVHRRSYQLSPTKMSGRFWKKGPFQHKYFMLYFDKMNSTMKQTPARMAAAPKTRKAAKTWRKLKGKNSLALKQSVLIGGFHTFHIRSSWPVSPSWLNLKFK